MKKTLFIGIILWSLSTSIMAQYVVNEADKQFELFNYVKAIDLYEQAWKKKEALHTAERLAMAYQAIQNYKEAESWGAVAANMPGSSPANRLSYAKALLANGKYSEAKQQYRRYAALATNSISAKQLDTWILSCDSAIQWMRSPKPVNIENSKLLNSARSDWGLAIYAGYMVFSSDRIDKSEKNKVSEHKPFLKFDGSKFPDKNTYGWTGNGYFRLYAKVAAQDSISLFPLPAQTDYHIGAASFSADGNEVYFTLTRIPKLSSERNKLLTINVEIYSSKNMEGKWSKPVPFAYNKVEEYSVGDPYLARDGNTLYFSSNMPGGMGGTDLYACFRTNGGDWGQPINLREVNTEGNERTPIFDKDDNLYFSSDGRIGMGGLDIYKASKSKKGTGIGNIDNLGYPINSPQDDFAFNPNLGDGRIYFASNRIGGMGSDDIYSYVQQKVSIALKLKGVVYHKETKLPLKNAMVGLAKIDGGDLKVETDSLGRFSFDLQERSVYELTADKTGFRSDKEQISTIGLEKSGILEKQLYLDPIAINKPIRLENIYYDFDKADIRADAAIELDKLVKIMQDNPTIWIELGSHTDSRGNDQYNQWLSQRRANSAVQYIIDRGIAKNRITAKGYGESQLLNECTNGVKCTEAEHQLNRRTEFKITKQ